MTGVFQPYRGVWPEIAADAYVADTAVVVGDVVIGAESSLWFGVIARGDVNDIRIGERTNIQDGTVIHVSRALQGTYIGDDVTIGHMALLHACTLEDGCFIGMRACVMDGSVVESGAMVAAGALVTPGKHVKAGELWSGVPAKVMRQLRPDEVAHMSEAAARYRRLAAEYRRASARAPA
ncbi:MAG: gamma carbonic anhydrase family protein [Alphaproteobacteria bacterium]